jgi:hypothetical protein
MTVYLSCPGLTRRIRLMVRGDDRGAGLIGRWCMPNKDWRGAIAARPDEHRRVQIESQMSALSFVRQQFSSLDLDQVSSKRRLLCCIAKFTAL